MRDGVHRLLPRERNVSRRQFRVSLWLAALVLVLAGCASPSGTSTGVPAVSSTVLSTVATQPTELLVFAAASLTDAMTELEQTFEAAHPGVDVLMNFGGSSRLATQILEGARVDVFAPADHTQMTNVADAGLVAAGPFDFAANRLVIITPRDNPAGIATPADLAQPGVALILAIPGVPIRTYSDQVIAALAADDRLGADFAPAVYANVVSEEENVRQVVAKVALGEADAGLVYTSDVTADVADAVAQVPIPADVNVQARYPIAQLRDAPSPALAAAFIDLVRSETGGAILAKWGFAPVHDE
jgi:molybdate transport system substrate-binding protein